MTVEIVYQQNCIPNQRFICHKDTWSKVLLVWCHLTLDKQRVSSLSIFFFWATTLCKHANSSCHCQIVLYNSFSCQAQTGRQRKDWGPERGSVEWLPWAATQTAHSGFFSLSRNNATVFNCARFTQRSCPPVIYECTLEVVRQSPYILTQSLNGHISRQIIREIKTSLFHANSGRVGWRSW